MSEDKLRADYLKRTYPQYRMKRYEDGVYYIQTRFRPDDWGMTYDVYVFSDSHLAACVPPRTGRSLLKRFPQIFTLYQDAIDGVVLLFEEKDLQEMAEPLKLRRKREVSEIERRRLREMGVRNSPFLKKALP